VEQATGSHVVGAPETVTARLDQLIADTAADEIMVTTNVWDHGARLHSYELLAALAGLDQAAIEEQQAAPAVP
jgi:alkanesulfonate monooxygenase SsuD/methylene tetrahydromethanopterin reductase-like flavin-dependent oxidoreductase (luciferase family)